MAYESLTQKFPELLSPTLTPSVAAQILGMSKTAVYAAIREDKFPFPVLRIGGRIVIPTAPVREALGLSTTEQGVA